MAYKHNLKHPLDIMDIKKKDIDKILKLLDKITKEVETIYKNTKEKKTKRIKIHL